MARLFCLMLALFFMAAPAAACSWGNPTRRLQDEIQSYYDADVVFLAKIGDVSSLPPTEKSPYSKWSATFQILEIYRGTPEEKGILVDDDLQKPGLGGRPPPPVCMNGMLYPQMQGKIALVFATKLEDSGMPRRYQVVVQTTQVDNCTGCDDLLQRMRLYGKFEEIRPWPP